LPDSEGCADFQAEPAPDSLPASKRRSAPEEAREGDLEGGNPYAGQEAEDIGEEELAGDILQPRLTDEQSALLDGPRLTDEQFTLLDGHFWKRGIDIEDLAQANLVRLIVESAQQLGMATMEQMYPGDLQTSMTLEGWLPQNKTST
jgi:hypothetical protein